MKILAISDWRLQPVTWITALIEQHAPDVVLYAGDDLKRLLRIPSARRRKRSSEVSLPHCIVRSPGRRGHKWAATKTPFYFVPGNDDDRILGSRPASKGFTIICGTERVTVYASGCTPGLKSRLLNVPTAPADIYLSHLPPFGVLDLAARFGVAHIGSRPLREAVRRNSPRLVVCGHCHFWGGHKASLGDTTVINVASSDNDPALARFGMIETTNWSVDCATYGGPIGRTVRGFSSLRREIRDAFFAGKPGAKALWKAYHDFGEIRRKGLSNFAGPAELISRLEELPALGISVGCVKRIIARVESIGTEAPELVHPLSKLPVRSAFCDVETGRACGHTPGKLWLIGILHGNHLRQYEWPADAEILASFLREADIRTLVSWTDYDRKALAPHLAARNIKMRFADACARVSRCLTWHDYSLDALHAVFFPELGRRSGISGAAAGLYADHIIFRGKECRFCPQSADLKKAIREKNRFDLTSMWDIWNRLSVRA